MINLDGLILGTQKNGAGDVLDGFICELLIYNDEQTGSNLSAIESYLKAKYATH